MFRIVVPVVLSIVLTACDRSTVAEPEESKKTETEWIDPNEIQFSPIHHESLPEELLTRIKNVHSTFADVDGASLSEWITDFKRDGNPEENVEIWEDMQTAYLSYCKDRDLDLATRKEVFRVLLFRSMASRAYVLEQLELSILSTDDAEAIMNAYSSDPKPIEMIEVDQ